MSTLKADGDQTGFIIESRVIAEDLSLTDQFDPK